MRLLKRRSGGHVASTAELLAEIERLTAANRAHRDHETERRLLWLRHLAGIRLLTTNGDPPGYPSPDAGSLPDGELHEIAPAKLTPQLLRAGILRDGCVLVRGLIEPDRARSFAAQIDRTFDERLGGGSAGAGYYAEFIPEPPYDVAVRPWVLQGGGVLAVDSPALTYEMLELFESAGVPSLASGYLGERALISAHKTTLRRASPDVPGAWHQDGAFMGDARALNLWLSLSRCGDEAPGLDIIPRRLDHVVVDRAGRQLDFDISHEKAVEVAGDTGIMRPIFEPGDALFFDELFLHQTGSDPAMPKPRFAVECWFFGASSFPSDYAPIAV